MKSNTSSPSNSAAEPIFGSDDSCEPNSQKSNPLTTEPSLNIVLAGNPNVGKSVIFNALTGSNADVSNYPGTTIDIAKGKLDHHHLADTPGVYGVSSFNDEERAARKMILEADLVINVVSALTLERDLFLTLQLLDMAKPMLLVVNQWDEAINRGIEINLEILKASLGLEVISCVAVANKGLEQLKSSLPLARRGKPNETIFTLVNSLSQEKQIDPAHALLLLEGDETTVAELGLNEVNTHPELYSLRRHAVNDVVRQAVFQRESKRPFNYKLGKFLLHPFYGSAIALTVCYFIFYQVLGVWIAGNLVEITEKQTMKVYWEPNIRKLAATVFPSSITVDNKVFEFPEGTLKAPAKAKELETLTPSVKANEIHFDFWKFHNFMAVLGNILVGEYGLATLTVTYLLGLLMPLVIGFYLGLALLEDSGYLPRLAVLVDRLMNKIGLNGRAIIPLILGLGCVTMATITTRLLTSRREKIIATALLGVAIPCSAQLGVVSGTLAHAGGFAAWAVYGITVSIILGVTGLLLNMILPGKSTGLMIDLPPMRLPRADNVLKKTWKKSWNFLLDAIPMFFIAGFAVSVAQMLGLLDLFMKALTPIVVNWLQLPDDPRIPTTFILGIVRRDFASFGLADVNLTSVQAITAMIVITLFVPCIATVGVMIKERGPKIAFGIWFGSWAMAFVIGGFMARGLPFILGPLGIK